MASSKHSHGEHGLGSAFDQACSTGISVNSVWEPMLTSQELGCAGLRLQSTYFAKLETSP